MDKKFDAAAVHYDRDKVSLSALQPGQSVLIQCYKSEKWDRRGEIIEVRPDSLSYLVELEGKVIIRGRAMFKSVFNECGGGQVQVQDQDRGQGRQQDGELSPSSVSSPAFKKTTEKEEENWSSLRVPAQTGRAMPQNCGSSNGCRDCIASRPRIQRTQLINPREGSPIDVLCHRGNSHHCLCPLVRLLHHLLLDTD